MSGRKFIEECGYTLKFSFPHNKQKDELGELTLNLPFIKLGILPARSEINLGNNQKALTRMLRNLNRDNASASISEDS